MNLGPLFFKYEKGWFKKLQDKKQIWWVKRWPFRGTIFIKFFPCIVPFVIFFFFLLWIVLIIAIVLPYEFILVKSAFYTTLIYLTNRLVSISITERLKDLTILTEGQLTHLLPMHSFLAHGKHHKTVRFSDVFRGVEKGCIGKKWVKHRQLIITSLQRFPEWYSQ